MSDLLPDDAWRPGSNGKPKPNGKPRPQPAGKVYPTANAALEDLRQRFGKESAKWAYYDADAEPVGLVVRWDNESGKDIRPISRGSEGWQITAMPEPRPLYGLRELLGANQSVPVVVCEGEKAADAATRCGLLAVTSAGGAQAAAKTDWSPLAGRRVIILPDHDAAGEKYAEDVAALAYAAGAEEIRILRLADYAPELPEGGDLADVLEAEGGCGIGLGGADEPADFGRLLLRLADETVPWTPDAEPWPETIPTDLGLLADTPLAWEPFPTAALPEPVRSFVERSAEAIGCDPSFLALPALTVCAAAIGNTRRIKLKSGWEAPPILWTAIVGESGTGKTPAFRLVLRPVRELQQKVLKRHAEAMMRFEVELAVYDKAVAEWRRDKNAVDDPPRKPEEPQAERFIVGDTTVEALAPILQSNPRGLLLARDELNAWLGSFDRYSARGGADAANWLSMHVGEAVIVDRKTGERRTIYVPSAAVSIIGGIQPGVLRRSLTEELCAAGLPARLLLAYPPRRAKQWTEAEIDSATEAAFARLVETLYGLQPDVGEDGEPRPVIFKLSREAKARFVAFYEANAKEQVELEGDLASAWSKLEEYAARLALVVHCIRVAAGDRLADAGVVDDASMESAILLVEWFKREARRVYAMLTETDEDAARRTLIEWIAARGGSVTARDLARGPRQFRGKADYAEETLNDLVQAGFGDWETASQNQKGGRPKRVFRLSPMWRRRQNPKKPRVSGGFVAVASVAAPENAPIDQEIVNLMPPIDGNTIEGDSMVCQETIEAGEDEEWMAF